MNTPQPKISVIIAVYNTAQYLRKCLDSVINQTFTDWELICVNDGSTDDSLNILREYEAKDKRISVYSQNNSGSLAAPFNRGIERAKGKYIFSLDSDDYLSEDLLEKCFHVAQENNADLVIPDMLIVDNNDSILNSYIGYNGDRTAELTNKKTVELSLDWQIHGKGLYNSQILKTIKNEENVPSTEYSGRLWLLACNKIKFSKGTYYYVQHKAAITKKFGMRIFYYVELDYKIMHLLISNNFSAETIKNFEWKRIQRLISTFRLYFRKTNEIETKDKKYILEIIKKSYYDISIKNVHTYIKELPLKKNLRTRIIFLNYFVFYFYCLLKK